MKTNQVQTIRATACGPRFDSVLVREGSREPQLYYKGRRCQTAAERRKSPPPVIKHLLITGLLLLCGLAHAYQAPYPTAPQPYVELDNGDTIVVKMGGAKTTTEPTYFIAYCDSNETGMTPANSKGSFNDTTEVSALATPAAGTHRQVSTIVICNIDTVSQNVFVSVANGANRYYLLNTFALPANATVSLNAGSGIVSGTALALPVSVPNGGTGQTSLTSGAYLIGNGTGDVSLVGPGSAAQIPISSGTTQVMRTLSGDVTNDSSGVMSIGALKVTNAMLAGSIVDSKLSSSYIYANGTRAFTGNQDLGGFKFTGSADPSALTDVATKNYVDQVAGGLETRSARLATAAVLPAYVYANGVLGVGATLTGTVPAALTIDSTSLAVGDRIVVKNEAGANQPYNGVYSVTVVGTGVTNWVLTRTIDADDSNDFNSLLVLVTAGSTNSNTSWICTAGSSITVGTTNITFTQYQVGQGTTVGGDLSGTVGSATLVKVAGTNSNGGIPYSTAGAMALLSGTATAGKVLQSGASAAPTWSTPTYPSASGTNLKWLRSDGTNNVYSTSTLAEGAVTSGKLLQSDGTNWIASTPTYPSASPAAGAFPRGDGTNFVTSTLTIPNAATQGDIVYSNAANAWVDLAAGSAGQALTTGGTGANPAWKYCVQAYTTQTANYTLVQGDCGSWQRVSGNGTIITLPRASTVGAGWYCWIQNNDAVNTQTIKTNATNPDTINGLTGFDTTGLIHSVKYTTFFFASNGTSDWLCFVEQGGVSNGGNNIILGTPKPATLTTGTGNVLVGAGVDTNAAGTIDSISVGRGAKGAQSSIIIGAAKTSSTTNDLIIETGDVGFRRVAAKVVEPTDGAGTIAWLEDAGAQRITTQADRTATTLSGTNMPSWTLISGRNYTFYMEFYITANTTGGLKMDLNGGNCTVTTGTAVVYCYLNGGGTTIYNAPLTGATALSTLGISQTGANFNATKVIISGTLVCNGSGTLIPESAQAVASGTSSWLVGSFGWLKDTP